MAHRPTVGLELTFLPDKPGRWKEYRDKGEAVEAANDLNRIMIKDEAITALRVDNIIAGDGIDPPFEARADTFRAPWVPATKQPFESWCIEIGNAPFPICDLTLGTDTVCARAIAAVYKCAEQLGLYPAIERKRGGVIKDYPTGGGHMHLSTSFWEQSSVFLPRLYYFEQSLCMDYVNNPWIRWLFSQWSDNVNSMVAVNAYTIRTIQRSRRRLGLSSLRAALHEMTLVSSHAIKQRFAYSGKSEYPTYEFRFFDMPRNVGELVLQARFLEAWVDYHVEAVEKLGGQLTTKDWVGKYLAYQLTPSYYRRLTKDRAFARKTIAAFMTRIGVAADPILDAFWERCYVRRMEFGKAL